MSVSPIPANELERLEALRSLNILDTPAEEQFDRITEIAHFIFKKDIVLLSLVDENRQFFKSIQGNFNISESKREGSFCAHAICEKELLHIPDALEDERFKDHPFVKEGILRFYIGIIIKAPSGHPIGTLCIIDKNPQKLKPAEIHILQNLAKCLEKEIKFYEISNAEQELRKKLSEAEKKAAIDPLTRTWNRSAILEVLNKDLSYSFRHKIPFALVMMDIDHFKSINDNYGHLTGDMILQEVSKRIRNRLRTSDSIGRYGGEEFLILINNCTKKQAMEITDDLRLETYNTPYNTNLLNKEIKVSASFGLYYKVADEVCDARVLVDYADRALYLAKGSGRNCIKSANDEVIQ